MNDLRKRMWHTYYDGCCAICQRTVNYVSMSCNPAAIGGTPINIAWMIVENIFKGRCCINQISRSGMENALWFSGRAADIEKKNYFNKLREEVLKKSTVIVL